MLLLVLGVFACSTAVILIKACTVDAVLLSAYRLLVAAVALTPAMAVQWRRHREVYGLRAMRRSVVPGLLLAMHFVTWIAGARMTLSANASLLVNLVPVAMPFLAYFAARERVNGGELAGTALALLGAVLLGAADFRLSRRTFLGDGICFASMLFLALYLAYGRRHRDVPGTWLYVVPLYYAAGLFCLLAALALGRVPALPGRRDLLLVLALGLVPTVAGHSILLHAMRTMRSQLVSIVSLGQFVFAGLMAYPLFGEVPSGGFYAAGVLLVAGSVIAIRATPRAVPPAARPAPPPR